MKATNENKGFIPPRAGFTLIELLVVVAIIGVLFAVAMPVFENAGRKDTERAAVQLIGTMRLARQHAINKRQWVIVLFPNADGGDYDEDSAPLTVQHCLRSYAVLAVTGVTVAGVASIEELERPDQTPDNMQFSFISDWKTFPEGIYLDPDPELNGNFIFRDKSTAFQYPVDPGKPNEKVRPMSVALFKPNGRAYVMVGTSSKSGKYWQDKPSSKIYMTSAAYYEPAGERLGPVQEVPGTNTVVEIMNKTGQVGIWDGDL